ncbi:hypothetical protein ONE63_005211 [Megalurothrips usitatus]|uniref:C2H2-type domain-containing protein n=1 Tax=Megalurothrips usitatus TaxID=439358 RepID=A0AAV7XVP5_9NEOP|nr:hypothetical protein ONE63_005211 [Megalurothrips usitatus]
MSSRIQCPICLEDFNGGLRQLVKHYKIHEGLVAPENKDKNNEWAYIPFKKNVDKKVGQEEEEGQKKAKVKRYLCLLCYSLFGTKGNVKIHLQSVHRQDKCFACKTCGKKFSTKANRKTHTVGCQKKLAVKAHIKVVEAPYTLVRKGEYKCNSCSKRFNLKANIENHVIQHGGDARFECSQCGERFRIKHEANKHVKVQHAVVDDVYLEKEAEGY